ncbi:hypothetical protein RFI_19433, partial [Reticulomyxa filosa]
MFALTFQLEIQKCACDWAQLNRQKEYISTSLGAIQSHLHTFWESTKYIGSDFNERFWSYLKGVNRNTTTPGGGGEDDLLLLLTKPESAVDPVFVACMTAEESRRLDVGDSIDLRNVHGYFEIAQVTDRSVSDGRFKVHVPGQDPEWDIWLNCSDSNPIDLRRVAKHKSISRRPIYRERMKSLEVGHYCDVNLSWIGLSDTWVNAQVRMKCQFGSGQYQFVYFHPQTQQEQFLWLHVDNMRECAPYGTKTVLKDQVQKEEEEKQDTEVCCLF